MRITECITDQNGEKLVFTSLRPRAIRHDDFRPLHTSLNRLKCNWSLLTTIDRLYAGVPGLDGIILSTPKHPQGFTFRGVQLAQWLELSTSNRVFLGLNPAAETSLRNFGNSVYSALPVSFGGDTKSRRYLVSMPGEVQDHTQGGGGNV